MTVTSTPAETRCTAVAWRKLCGVTCLVRSVGAVAGFVVACAEHPRFWRSRLPLQQLFQQHHGFRPERADALLATLAKEAHAAGRVEPDGLGTQVERLLYPCAAVVEEREQRMIAHAFECRTAWLGKDRRHLCRIQIAGFRYRRPLDRGVG